MRLILSDILRPTAQVRKFNKLRKIEEKKVFELQAVKNDLTVLSGPWSAISISFYQFCIIYAAAIHVLMPISIRTNMTVIKFSVTYFSELNSSKQFLNLLLGYD